ncbi:hypothetical protein C8R46DRAFT_1065519 [Mycena filopes]|nr:hypothetical protein C8R46DRAFT_1065519 [Mycena filopes]
MDERGPHSTPESPFQATCGPHHITAVGHTVHFVGLLVFHLGVKLPFVVTWDGGSVGGPHPPSASPISPPLPIAKTSRSLNASSPNQPPPCTLTFTPPQLSPSTRTSRLRSRCLYRVMYLASGSRSRR